MEVHRPQSSSPNDKISKLKLSSRPAFRPYVTVLFLQLQSFQPATGATLTDAAAAALHPLDVVATAAAEGVVDTGGAGFAGLVEIVAKITDSVRVCNGAHAVKSINIVAH